MNIIHHIHAIYNKEIALIDIQTLNVIEGNLPPRALKLVEEWIKIHKQEIKKCGYLRILKK